MPAAEAGGGEGEEGKGDEGVEGAAGAGSRRRSGTEWRMASPAPSSQAIQAAARLPPRAAAARHPPEILSIFCPRVVPRLLCRPWPASPRSMPIAGPKSDMVALLPQRQGGVTGEEDLAGERECRCP